jgi:general secretion pathway protein G
MMDTEKMKKPIVKKRYVTLIEMMIVMFLIALITGVIAYNYRGSLEEGKAFKSKAGMEKIEMILNLRIAEDPDLLDNINSQWQEVIKRDPLVKDANSLIKDGWGKPYDVTVENNVIRVRSQKYNEYKKPGS